MCARVCDVYVYVMCARVCDVYVYVCSCVCV